jgi:hypothetical protein
MERRDILKSASTLAAASTVGMAGCNGILGGGGCDTPGDNLEDSLPDSDDYEMQGEATTGSGEQDNVESTVSALYIGPDDGEFLFGITQFSSSDEASSEAENVSSDASGSDGAFGYIVVDSYVFVAFGPDEDSTTAIMKASPTLSDGCVDDNIEFA